MRLAEAISLLKDSKKFTHIDLRDQQIGDEGVEALVEGIGNIYSVKPPLQYIDLSGNHLSIQGIKSLARLICALLEQHTSILSLSLNNIGLDDEGLELILNCFIEYYSPVPEEAGQVPRCIAPLRLSLDNNRIGPNGAKRLADMLARYGAIRYLSLNHNALGDEGAKTIGVALPYNVGLKHLSLSHNSIGDEGLTAIARGLMDNITLRELELSHNRCSDLGASTFASLFNQNVGLSTINLQDNMITDDGVSKMGLALLENVTLDMIRLEGNQLSTKGLEEFDSISKHLSDVKALKKTVLGVTDASSSAASGHHDLLIEFESPLVLRKFPIIHCRGTRVASSNCYSQDPSSLVHSSMCQAGLFIQHLKQAPKANKIRLKRGTTMELQYMWTALMVLGEKLPHIKFGHEAIAIDSVGFDPRKKEIGALWRRFAMGSLYERVFKHHLRPYMLDIVAFPKRYIAELEKQADVVWLEEYQKRLIQIRPLAESRRQETRHWLRTIKQHLVNQLRGNLPVTTDLSELRAKEKKAKPKKDIFFAARTGKTAIARRLLEKGVSPNDTNEDGETPVLLAVASGHIPIVELLLKHGATLDAIDDSDDSIIFYTLLDDRVEMLDWLLRHGGSANEVDINGCSILFSAILRNKGNMVSCLLAHGADVNYKYNDMTPLQFAQYSGRTEIAALLLKHGAHDSTTSMNESTFASSSSSSSSSSTGGSAYMWAEAPQSPFHTSTASQSSATSSSGISSASFSADYVSSSFISAPSAPAIEGYSTSSGLPDLPYQAPPSSFSSSIGTYGSYSASIPPASYYSDYYAVPSSSSSGHAVPISPLSSFDMFGNHPSVYTTPGIPHFFSSPPLYSDTSASMLPPVSSAPDDNLFDAPPKTPTDFSTSSSTQSEEHVISFLEQGANVSHQETSTSSGSSTTYSSRLFTSQAEVQTALSATEKTVPEIPAFLTCPITATGELMEEPVSTTGTGQTYERAAIAKWLESHDTDPMTRETLIDKKLTPNIGIRQAIEHFKETTRDNGLRI